MCEKNERTSYVRHFFSQQRISCSKTKRMCADSSAPSAQGIRMCVLIRADHDTAPTFTYHPAKEGTQHQHVHPRITSPKRHAMSLYTACPRKKMPLYPCMHALMKQRSNCRVTHCCEPRSTPDHDSVAAAVSRKHHSIISVGAGPIQFVHATCA